LNLIISIIIGGVAGWLASLIMNTKGGIIKNVVLGIIGGFVGGYVLGLLNISLPFNDTISTIITSLIGACLVILVARLISK
jgi:uncharacterized membrane protein YeaQ/YmgE (transglycosylase-associated protein family)